jgi:hypothetical protein
MSAKTAFVRAPYWAPSRVETKIFVFVFFAFREKKLTKSYENNENFRKNFRENENVWENGRRKQEILRCQIRMVLQNKSDNSNGQALLYCLLRMVLQNKSDNSTVHHALQNCQSRMVLQNKSDSSNGHVLKSSSFWRCLSQKRTHFRENFKGNENFRKNENFREISQKFTHFRIIFAFRENGKNRFRFNTSAQYRSTTETADSRPGWVIIIAQLDSQSKLAMPRCENQNILHKN